jgi:hypothetical protein
MSTKTEVRRSPRIWATVLGCLAVGAPAVTILVAMNTRPGHASYDTTTGIWHPNPTGTIVSVFLLGVNPVGVVSSLAAVVLGIKQRRWGIVAVAVLGLPLAAYAFLCLFALAMSDSSIH